MGSASSGNGVGLSGHLASSLSASRGQMDVNMLYQKLIELGDLLKENREKTRGIVASAEEYAKHRLPDPLCQGGSSTHSNTILVAQVAELQQQNLDLRNTKELLIIEQRENSKLLAEYETAVGEILEKIRNISFEQEGEKLKISRKYNTSLQEEKDAHLRTRLERDEWHSRCLQALEMLRKAHRLQSEEEDEPVRVIGGLQNEVRGYRHALGLQPEKPQEECGYDFLRPG